MIPILFFVVFINLILGLFVILRSRSHINTSFFAIALSVIFWSISNNFADIVKNYTSALLLTRLSYVFAICISFSFLCFSFYFPRVIKDKKRLTKVLFLVSFAASVVLALMPAFITGVEIQEWGVNVQTGSLFLLFYLSFVTYLLISFYLLIKKYFRFEGVNKVQIQYFFWGALLTTIGGVVTTLILPSWLGLWYLSKYGPYFTVFLIGFTAYAIVRHRLMDIRAVVARSVAYTLLLVTLAGGYALAIFGAQTYLFPEAGYGSVQVAVQVGLAIVMAFTFQPLRRFLTKITDKIFFKDDYDLQELLKKTTDNAYSTLNLGELLHSTIKILIDEMKISRGIFVLATDKNVIAMEAIGYQKTPEYNHKEIKGLVNHHIILSDDLDESSYFKDILRKKDASISIGLKDKNEPIGVLFLGEKSSGDMYTTKDLKFFEILAPEMVVAIQRAKEHEKIQNFNEYLKSEIVKKTKALTKANEHLLELDKAKDEFISMASHQIRTPLTTIKGYLSMLIDGDVGELKVDQLEFVNEAFEGSNRMVALINDLLNVSRMDTGRFFLELTGINLDTIVKEEIKQLTKTATDKGLYLKFEKSKSAVPVVIADAVKMRQVVMNFIDNAIYYTQKGGVTVSLEKEGKDIVFKVKDTGIGVPEAQKKELFTKFFRADNAKNARPDGTGLGIYMAKRVMEDHNGKVIFESKEGEGSTFGFALPIRTNIKKELTIAPADLQVKAEGVGSGK